MAENKDDKPVSEDRKDGETGKKIASSLALVLLLLLVGVLSWAYFEQKSFHDQGETRIAVRSSVQDTDLLPRLEALEAQNKLVEERLAALELKTPLSEENKEGRASVSSSPEALDRLKKDMASLSVQITELQAKTKENAKVSDEARDASLFISGRVVGFVRLQEAIANGGPFDDELQTMKKQTEEDPDLASIWEKLDPLATEGVVSYGDLRAELRDKASEITDLLRKSRASSWQDRLWSALQSLISVHRVGDPVLEDETLKALDASLKAHKAADVLKQVEGLPDTVQKALASWGAEVAAKQKAEEGMHALADYLSAVDETPVPGNDPPGIPADGED